MRSPRRASAGSAVRGGRRPGAGGRESLDQGRLCVMVMRSKSLPGFLAATARALVGLARRTDMEQHRARHMVVNSRGGGLTVAIDGESAELATPFEIAIRPRALTAAAPR